MQLGHNEYLIFMSYKHLQIRYHQTKCDTAVNVLYNHRIPEVCRVITVIHNNTKLSHLHTHSNLMQHKVIRCGTRLAGIKCKKKIITKCTWDYKS